MDAFTSLLSTFTCFKVIVIMFSLLMHNATLSMANLVSWTVPVITRNILTPGKVNPNQIKMLVHLDVYSDTHP